MKRRTSKTAASRFKITKGGKVLHRGQGSRHVRTNKSNSALRRLDQVKVVSGAMVKKVKQMLGKA